MMKNITTILLDLDGTLLDFKKAQSIGVQKVLEQNGIKAVQYILDTYEAVNHRLWQQYERGEISREEIFEARFSQLFKIHGIGLDGKEVERQYRNELDNSTFLVDNALDVVKELHNKNYDLYVVTNGVAATQFKRLKASGLEPFFKKVFVSEEVGYQKPDIRFLEKCLDSIAEKDLSRMMIVGDSLSSDILGGNNWGISTCWFNPSNSVNNTGVHVDIEIHELKELLGYLT